MKLINKLLNHICSVIALLLLTVLYSSCATIISGTSAKIQIDGAVDEHVNIVTSKNVYRDISLPTTVEVKRRSLDGQHIQISSENYAFSDIVLRKSNNPWSILSAALYGVPLLVDLMTNAASEPAQNHFFITPSAPRSQADSLYRADSLRWAEAEREFLRQIQARQLPQRYKRHEIRGSVGFGECQASHDKDKMISTYKDYFDVTNAFECGDIFGDAFVQAGIEYHYRLNRKWEIGMLVNWGVSNDNYDTSNDFDYYYSSYGYPHLYGYANEHCNFFVFAPSVRYTWYETPKYRLFSRVALGAMRHHLSFDVDQWENNDPNTSICRLVNEEYYAETKWRMAYQISPIGICVGAHNLKFIAELGYGCLGVLNMGVCVSF